MTKIVTFAVRYSPNLGDGVISDCLEAAILFAVPDADVVHIDLAGRQNFGDITVRNRGLVLKLLPLFPLAVRQRIVKVVLGRKLSAYRDVWKEALKDADLAVVGGGQLFADADLNFPLKVAALADCCAETQTPTAIYAVGVARGWSTLGRAHFARLFNTCIKYIAVRDVGSKERLKAETGNASLSIGIVPDPAVIAYRCYGDPPVELTRIVGGRIGICITAKEVLLYHADMNVAGAGGVSSLFVGLITELIERGEDIALFTNGAAEDERALDSICSVPRVATFIQEGRVFRHPKFSNPTELVQGVSAHKAIVAHRLHAIIIAYSYRIPSVGLGWDEKVLSFFKTVGREEYCVTDDKISAQALCDYVLSSLNDAIDPNCHAELVAAADLGINQLLGAAVR